MKAERASNEAGKKNAKAQTFKNTTRREVGTCDRNPRLG